MGRQGGGWEEKCVGVCLAVGDGMRGPLGSGGLGDVYMGQKERGG